MDVVQGDHRVIPLVISFCDVHQLDEMVFCHNKKEQTLNSLCSFYISGGIIDCQIVRRVSLINTRNLSRPYLLSATGLEPGRITPSSIFFSFFIAFVVAAPTKLKKRMAA